MTREQADILAQLIDVAIEGNWPNVADQMTQAGWTPREIAAAAKVLTDLAGRTEILTEGDF